MYMSFEWLHSCFLECACLVFFFCILGCIFPRVDFRGNQAWGNLSLELLIKQARLLHDHVAVLRPTEQHDPYRNAPELHAAAGLLRAAADNRSSQQNTTDLHAAELHAAAVLRPSEQHEHLHAAAGPVFSPRMCALIHRLLLPPVFLLGRANLPPPTQLSRPLPCSLCLPMSRYASRTPPPPRFLRIFSPPWKGKDACRGGERFAFDDQAAGTY